MSKVLMSACLLGEHVRYNGGHLKVDTSEFQEFIDTHEIVPFCPEMAAGLPSPRIPAEISGGSGWAVVAGEARVLGEDGSDLTATFLKGAELALQICQKQQITCAVLAESSPSCGSSTIYNGKFEGIKTAGQGVTCALLEKHGIQVVSPLHVAELNL
ncbi:DUF523 domain-containing protein [Celerinatantimonas sp. YJH-8]|uniref:DUF523 domain-containing protein n=1 Tax=Celerinatantimonas sp. YJH-8 TaxID=3228714 RepID=UPI0038CB40AF